MRSFKLQLVATSNWKPGICACDNIIYNYCVSGFSGWNFGWSEARLYAQLTWFCEMCFVQDL